MYQRTYRREFTTTTFGESIDRILSNHSEHFINRVEYSLWKKYLKDFPEAREIESINRYLKVSLEYGGGIESLDELDIPPHLVVEILDSILTSKMGEMMLVKTEEQLETEPLAPSVTFKQYLDMDKGVDLDLNVLAFTLDKTWIEDTEDGKKPLYFVLYRLRNNLLHNIDERICTMEYIEKSMEAIKKKFKELILNQVLYNNTDHLSVEHIQNIFKKCETLIIHFFASDQRGGKTLEDGSMIYKEVTENIRKSSQLENLANKYGQLMEVILKDELDEGILRKWTNSYLDEFYEIALQFASPSYEKYNFAERFFKSVRDAIVEVILAHENPEKIISTGYADLTSDEYKFLFDWIYEQRLKFVNFTICLRVRDLKTDNSFSRLSLKDIEFLSDALFEGWQHALPFQKNRDRHSIVRSPEDQQNEYLWVLIHNVHASVKDFSKIYETAVEKLTGCLSLLYFFSFRDDEHDFFIEDQYLIYDRENEIMYHGSANKKRPLFPKSIDNLDPELIDVLVGLHDNNLKWKHDIIESIKNFEKFFRSSNVTEQMTYLKLVITSLFGDIHDYRLLAAACSVFVSGTNYKGSDVTFGNMREWLFEDFIEFFMLSDDQGKNALKERLVHRFKVFCKTVFLTTFINLDPLNKNGESTIQDIVGWLFYAYQHERPIVEGGIEQ